VLLDVLGYKRTQGGGGVQMVNGNEMLLDTYRITIDDLRGAMEMGGIDGFEPGDVILIRTGWWWPGENPDTFERFVTREPGIYIAEAKFLGENNPAIIGADTPALEVVGNPDLTEWIFPVHTELLVRKGIHLGEGIITHELAEAGIYQFVYRTYLRTPWERGARTPRPLPSSPAADWAVAATDPPDGPARAVRCAAELRDALATSRLTCRSACIPGRSDGAATTSPAWRCTLQPGSKGTPSAAGCLSLAPSRTSWSVRSGMTPLRRPTPPHGTLNVAVPCATRPSSSSPHTRR
jgi:hypothetical protein